MLTRARGQGDWTGHQLGPVVDTGLRHGAQRTDHWHRPLRRRAHRLRRRPTRQVAVTAGYVGEQARRLAICFDLLDEPQRTLASARLADLVAENGHHIATGFAGTPYVCDALTQTGHLDDAYLLLQQRECPSWLYPVTMGATTIWERWDSMLPDGTINPGQMTSFNHYALGAVVDWMHRVIGGIFPAQPGYRTVRVAPRPGGGLTWAQTSLETPQGDVTVAWRLAPDGALDVEVAVPDGITAEIDIPGADARSVGGGRHHVTGGVRQANQ